MKWDIITVLYEQELTSCETWRTLLAAAADADVRIIAADNSDSGRIRDANRKTAAEAGICYLDMEGNHGLSAAYDRALDMLFPAAGEEDPDAGAEWVITTDQDTVFPEDYLDRLREAAGRTKASVLAPVVRSGDVQISPCRLRSGRFVPCAAESLRPSEVQGLFFVNTGLALRSDLFRSEGLRYNEDLFLDFVDFDMVARIRQARPGSFELLPRLVLGQHFSGAEKRAAEEDLERYRLWLQDGKVFFDTWQPGNASRYAGLYARGARLALRHRDARFLKKG